MKEAWAKIIEGLRMIRWLVVLPSIASLGLLMSAWFSAVELDRVLAVGFANVVLVILSLQE